MSKATSNNPSRVAVIDADSIIYAAASVSERRVFDGDEEMWLDTQTVEECYTQVVHSIEKLMQTVGASSAIVCLTHRENFRTALLPSYKANRKEHREPTYRKPLVDLLQERAPFPVLIVQGLEADDVCGISSGTLQAAGNREPVICSEDKDLKTIPGWLYQKGELTFIPEGLADYYHMTQTLMGDATDNYRGCANVGAVKAAAILEPFAFAGKEWDMAAVWERVLAEFTLRGHPEDYALTQARVARILRSTDWDPSKREIILWTPPKAMTT